jgi:hypothetical protein
MIQAGYRIFLHELPFDAVIPLGTPAEVEAFLLRQPPVLRV